MGVIELLKGLVKSINGLTGAITLTSSNASITIVPAGSTIDLTTSGGGGGVSSLDGITGAVTLVAGSNITITDNSPTAGSITIASTGGGGGTPGGTSGQIQYNNSGSFGGFTVGGDGTLNTATGAITVTKTNGVSFAASATTDTTTTANITDSTNKRFVTDAELVVIGNTSGTNTGNQTTSGTTNRITVTTGSANPVIDISATYVGQTSITTLGTLTAGATGAGFTIALTTSTVTGVLTETHGGTNQSTYVTGDTLYASAANTLSKVTGNITITKQYLSQTGSGAASAAPVWATIAGADITGTALTKTDDTNVTMTLGGTPNTALLRAASMTLGWTGTLSGTRGGTGINNGASTITIGGNLAFSGAFTTAITVTGNTTVTLPTSGTLYGTATGSITSAQLLGSLSDETGTGVAVFNNGPTLIAPILGTPASGVATNLTGTASGLTSGITLALKSATTTVDVSAATAPSSGQVLTATSGTAATWQTPSSGSAVTRSISQANSFTAGQVLKFTAGAYALAQADSQSDGEVLGMVSGTGNPFTLTTNGYITGLSGLTANTQYFLDPGVAGGLTVTETSTVGQISKPIFFADSTTSGYLTNYRGEQISANDTVVNVSGTITPAGTTGNQTINKPSGSVNFAAASSSLVVTNSIVTANSFIFVNINTNDTTLNYVWAMPTAGSFTIFGNSGATAETKVRFLVVNAI